MKLPKFARHPVTTKGRQHGLSLVELMVALTIGLFLIGAVVSIYVATSRGTRGSTEESQMNEDASLALEILQQQLRLAAFSGFAAGGDRNFQDQAMTACNGGFNDNTVADFATLACVSNDDNPRPDSIAVRYEATLLNSQSVTVAGVQQPANCAHEGIAGWFGPSNVPLAENRYFIEDDPATNVPSLRCVGRNGANLSNAATVIPNIEDLQILYAVTRTPVVDEPLPHQVTGYLRADEVNALPNGWQRVAGARICIVARSTERFEAIAPELRQYRDCAGNQVAAPADGLLRRAFVTTVMARNLRPGVPAPFAVGANPWDIFEGEE